MTSNFDPDQALRDLREILENLEGSPDPDQAKKAYKIFCDLDNHMSSFGPPPLDWSPRRNE
jgi:hypothetical protein